MRTLLPLGALLALALVGCSNSLTTPNDTTPSYSCAGNSGNCGGGNHNNNPNNPPATTP
jgi:hypothetical protein